LRDINRYINVLLIPRIISNRKSAFLYATVITHTEKTHIESLLFICRCHGQFIIPLRKDIMRAELHAFAKILSAVFLVFSQSVTVRY